MTTWILICMIFGSGSSTAVATNSVVFHSKESCEKAAKKLNKHSDVNWAECFEDKAEEAKRQPKKSIYMLPAEHEALRKEGFEVIGETIVPIEEYDSHKHGISVDTSK